MSATSLFDEFEQGGVKFRIGETDREMFPAPRTPFALWGWNAHYWQLLIALDYRATPQDLRLQLAHGMKDGKFRFSLFEYQL